MGIKRAHTTARCLLLCPRKYYTTVTGSFTMPVIAESELPGLLGFKTMRHNRAVFDLVNLQLHFCGPADINLTFPPGTKSFQLEISPSGHLVLPCTNVENIRTAQPSKSYEGYCCVSPSNGKWYQSWYSHDEQNKYLSEY